MISNDIFMNGNHMQGCQEKSGGPGQKKQVGPLPNCGLYICSYMIMYLVDGVLELLIPEGLEACPRKILKFTLEEMQSRGILSQF